MPVAGAFGRKKLGVWLLLIDGLPVDEFIARNADPIWLHQNEMWELMVPEADDHEAHFHEYLDAIDVCEDEPDTSEHWVEPSSDAEAVDVPF